MTRSASLVAVVVSAACFATLGILQRWAFLHGADPLSLLAVRFATAALLMTAVQAIRDPRALRITRGDLVRFLGLSVTGYGAASLCYAFGVLKIGVSVTTVLLYTYPALVSIGGWLLFREPFPPRRIAAVAMTFVGCVLVANVLSSSVPINVPGIALGVGAGLGYAAFNVLSYRSLHRTPRLTLMAYTFGFSAIEMAAVAAAARVGSVTTWDPIAWVALALIVAVPTFAAVMLYLGGMKGLGGPQAAVISTLELPFAVMMASALFANERLSPVQLLGAAVVLAGVVLAEWGSAGVDMDGAPAV